jgi:trimeric autotransporter adhesin
MNINRVFCIALTLSYGLATALPTLAQTTTLFSDTFNRASLTVGAPTTYSTQVTSGDGGASIISSQFLRLTNDSSASANASGRVFVTGDTAHFDGFQPQLHTNVGALTWSFNAKSNRTSDPGGFGAGNYGLAVVLAATSSDLTAASGYAVAYGNPGAPDPIRLVRFTGGIDTDSNLTTLLSSGVSDLAGFANYASIKVRYTPQSDSWELFVRDDGASAWENPTTVSTQIGSAVVDSTFTHSPISSFGYTWNYNSGANQSAQFDNFLLTQTISPTAAPEPMSFAFVVVGIPVLRRRRRASGGTWA